MVRYAVEGAHPTPSYANKNQIGRLYFQSIIFLKTFRGALYIARTYAKSLPNLLRNSVPSVPLWSVFIYLLRKS